MSLQDLREKCKSDEVFTIILIILVGIGSFGLGRLSKIETLKSGLSIEAPAAVANALNGQNEPQKGNLEAINTQITPEMNKQAQTTFPSENSTGQALQTFPDEKLSGQVVASKSGTKYHFPWCSGAKSIAEKNKIWFDSIETARSAGYTPASNCKGLK